MRPSEAKNGSRPTPSHTPPPARLTRRSRFTKGKELFLTLRDGNSAWARRLTDLISLHVSDLGGPDAISEAEKALVRRASMLILQCELLEQRWARNGGEASEKSLIAYQRVASALRRILESLGLGRRSRNITPTVDEYLRQKAAQTEEDTEEANE